MPISVVQLASVAALQIPVAVALPIVAALPFQLPFAVAIAVDVLRIHVVQQPVLETRNQRLVQGRWSGRLWGLEQVRRFLLFVPWDELGGQVDVPRRLGKHLVETSS